MVSYVIKLAHHRSLNSNRVYSPCAILFADEYTL